jgi:trigger factor
VEEALTSLAETAKNFADRKKGATAKDGDQVIFDFLGKVDGEPFEGGAAEGHALVLGSGQFIPGFEEGLIGVAAGDEKNVEVTFPADYNAEHLAGKVAVFECKILNVKRPKRSEIDDEMAKQFGAEDLAGLKGQITSKLEEEYAGAARAVTKRALLDALDKMVSFELPPSLVEAEAGQIAHQLWHEDNPEVEGHDHPEVETTQEHTKLADRRVKLGLLLAEIGQKAEIQVSDAEFTQAVMNQARQYGDQARQFFEFVQQNPQMQQQIRAPLFEDKVVDHIVAAASMDEKEVSKDDLQKAVEALEEE